ncbi:hypothetical protein M1K46_20360 [Fictibacillus sp. WQ 8-8]|uniref:hypothetical protein n=1 Tax=unclassified Fictibacillus TaxID=2644029 RepID=UPI0015879746|nr:MULTISPECIES: hypothetical protein [unclassified Fictibacillus]MCQ6267979.1 hypothetical protein [Fictibacillus sp. WQ 8-8]MED2971212.1 hypothetical protein [Fictibacillus sp. B-59209]UZJ80033.1 hypothetical protein OKX00_06060 [Fictibacillus sp. KU28468]
MVILYNKDKKTYTDFSNVETRRRYVLPEDLPEGPYGSPINAKLGKSTPWEENQRYYSAFNYEYKNLHAGMERQYPGAHPTHDDPGEDTEEPYQNYK